MESALLLEIVTPDRSVVKTPADYVGVPGVEGEFGVLPQHIAMLSALSIGKLYYRHEGRTETVFIANGFAEIANNCVTVLAESAEKAQDIDTARAMTAKERAEARLAAHDDSIDAHRAQMALQRAINRLHIAGIM